MGSTHFAGEIPTTQNQRGVYIGRASENAVIQLTSNNVTPFIDFARSVGTDFDMRIECNNTNNLNIRGGSLTVEGATAWTSANDGPGSGLDADTLDGAQAGSFARRDTSNTYTGTQTYNGTNNFNTRANFRMDGVSSEMIRLTNASSGYTWISFASGTIATSGVGVFHIAYNNLSASGAPAESMQFRPRGQTTAFFVSQNGVGVVNNFNFTVNGVNVRNAAILTSGTIAAARLPAANTSTNGTARLTTNAEAIAGTNTVEIVTPSSLRAAQDAYFTDFNLGTIGSAITQISPGVSFRSAQVFVGGVPQLPGAGNAYTIGTSGTNNTIVFTQTVPAGVEVFGTVRR